MKERRELFGIRRVDRSQAESVEQMGSKPKFWFSDGGRRFLFKADDRGTGEDWAEVVACELCKLLGLPHVEYELAQEWDGERPGLPGVVCENMAPAPLSLVLGNQLLLEQDASYPTEQRFKVRGHYVEAVCEVLASLSPPGAEWMGHCPDAIRSSLDVFIGYVMLDSWIANQDRHHENWAAIRGDRLLLAPTFDHGAGFARNLTDAERAERLTTRDGNRSIAAFATRARSAFYADPEGARPMLTLAAFERFASRSPAAARTWIGRLAAIDSAAVSGILDRVPSTRMSDVTRRFTLELIEANRTRLLEVTLS